MKSRKEKWWEQLDGDASPEERPAFEKALQGDEDLQREYAMRRKLHEELQGLEPEQPSLRFTQSLMERLPNLYQRIQIGPLIGRGWKRAYLAIFTLCVLGLFGFGFNLLGSYTPSFSFNWVSDYLSVDLEASFPFRLALIVMSLATAVLFLMWLDRRLRGREEGE